MIFKVTFFFAIGTDVSIFVFHEFKNSVYYGVRKEFESIVVCSGVALYPVGLRLGKKAAWDGNIGGYREIEN